MSAPEHYFQETKKSLTDPTHVMFIYVAQTMFE